MLEDESQADGRTRVDGGVKEYREDKIPGFGVKPGREGRKKNGAQEEGKKVKGVMGDAFDKEQGTVPQAPYKSDEGSDKYD